MDIRNSYNQWAEQYDSNANKTRDLEAKVLRETLCDFSFESCLEIGCGTGKNTVWLAEKAKQVLAVDLSEEMLAKAKKKIQFAHVELRQADINSEFDFGDNKFDLTVFSLVLEHIESLGPVLKKAAAALQPGGHLYISKLHPFKQYSGSKARFETDAGTHTVQCFNHHVSDFLNLSNANGLQLLRFNEYFDDDDRTQIPRLLTMLFRKREIIS